MRTVALATLLGGSFIIIIIIIVLLFVFYLAEIGVSAVASSHGTFSLDYGIKELEYLSFKDDRDSSGEAVPANITMALSPNSSNAVYETETFVAPPTVKTFVIYMANEFHENWPEESHKLITNKNAYINFTYF